MFLCNGLKPVVTKYTEPAALQKENKRKFLPLLVFQKKKNPLLFIRKIREFFNLNHSPDATKQTKTRYHQHAAGRLYHGFSCIFFCN